MRNDLFIQAISSKSFVKKHSKLKDPDYRLLFPELMGKQLQRVNENQIIVRSIFYPFCGKFNGCLFKPTADEFFFESMRAFGVSSDFVCEYVFGFDGLKMIRMFWTLFMHKFNLLDEYEVINRKHGTVTQDLENILDCYDGLSVKNNETLDCVVLTKGKDYDEFCFKLMTVMKYCHLLEVLGNYYNFKLDDVEWSSW